MVNYVQVGQVVQVVKVVQANVPHTRCDTFFKFDIWWKWPSKLSRYVYVGIWTSGPTQTPQFLSFVAKIRLTCELYPWCILSYHAMSLDLFSFSCAAGFCCDKPRLSDNMKYQHMLIHLWYSTAVAFPKLSLTMLISSSPRCKLV